MAALKSTRFVRFALPPSNPLFCNGNTFWPAKTSQSIPSLTNSQKARRPAATLSRSGCQPEAERHTAARAEGSEPVSAYSDDKTDDDLPSLEELFRTPVPPSNISTKASKAERTLRHLEQPAPDATGTLIDQSKSGLGERQGDSPDQPVILDNESDEADTGDEAEGASVDIETRCLERDPSPYNLSATSEPASGPIKSIDTSGPWYDVEEGCYIDEPAPRLGSCEQQDMPSAPAQDQHQILFQSFQPLQDQISQQDVGSITRSMSVESAPHSLLQLPNGDDSMAGLEKELELAFLEQVKLLSASALNSPRPFSVEAPPDESQSREHMETTSISSEEMQDASRHGTPAQGLEEWEKRETEVVVEGGGVAMQQQQEFAAQKEELGQPVGEGDQQDVVDDDVADEPRDRVPTEALPAAPLKIPVIDEHRHISRASRSSSAPADTVLEDEPPTRKRGHQDAHTEISSDTHHSANIDDNHNACDTGDEDPRPAKRRKPRAALTVTSTTSQGHTPELHVGQPGPLVALSTATPEIDDAQPQVDHECLSTFVDNSHQYASRIPQSPSVASEAVPVAEYREWPFQGFLKRTRIGDDMTYNLEFKLPSILEHIHLPIDPKGLDICSSEEAPAKVPTHHETAAHSNTCQTPLQPKKKRKHIKWTPEEDATLLQMRDDGSSWEYIFAALPGRNEGAIRMRYSTKLKKRSRTGPDRC